LARVLIEDPRVVILDEPTSALNAQESDRLAVVLRELRHHGTTVLYVSHRLQEVFAVSDVISVVRDGRVVLTAPSADLTIPGVVQAMIGGASLPVHERRAAQDTEREVVFRATGLATYGQLHNATLEAAAGEIIGVAGLVGSGAEELMLALFGATPCRSGEARYPDGGGLPRSPTAAAGRGIALVPADRKRVGVMLDKSIADNISQVSIGAIGAGSFMISRERLAERGRAGIKALAIKAAGPEVPVRQLSGGNQQKVVLAKWLEVEPNLILLDDPTRGVDVGAKMEIFRIMRDLASRGTTVIFRSTEIAELTALCDRVFVIRDGVITDVVTDADEEELLAIINSGHISKDDS
jgi:ribose transport system ATP-binding protein